MDTIICNCHLQLKQLVFILFLLVPHLGIRYEHFKTLSIVFINLIIYLQKMLGMVFGGAEIRNTDT